MNLGLEPICYSTVSLVAAAGLGRSYWSIDTLHFCSGSENGVVFCKAPDFSGWLFLMATRRLPKRSGCDNSAIRSNSGQGLSSRLSLLFLVRSHGRVRLGRVPSYLTSSGLNDLILRQSVSNGRATAGSETSAEYLLYLLSFCLCTAPQDWLLL